MHFFQFILVSFVFQSLNLFAATIYYVDYRATGSNDGSSWSNAFTQPQLAFNIAQNGDEVRISQGRYVPTTSLNLNPRSKTFLIGYNGSVLGGYAGVGTPDPDARDVILYETIFSGDINGDDDISKGFEDGARNSGENCFRVIGSSGATCDGLTISNGNNQGPAGFANSNMDSAGAVGGIYINCKFTQNSADYLGAVKGVGCQKCYFLKNYARAGGGAGSGGFEDCIFELNDANYGGACTSGTFNRCLFIKNTANRNSYLNAKGGALYRPGRVENCIFDSNESLFGGGIYTESIFITTCVFYNNTNGGVGVQNGNPTIHNSIFWANSGGSQIRVDANSFPTIEYSCVQGGWSGLGSHNISSDPLFVNAIGIDGIAGTVDADFRLQAGSPCIDAGFNNSLPSTDFTGNRRTGDDPGVVDSGTGTAPIVDMGAYERFNTRPWAREDFFSGFEDVPFEIEVLNNDIRFNNGPISLVSVTQPARGTVSISGNKILFTPALNQFGLDSFTYTIESNGQQDTGVIQGTITNVNDPPSVVMPESHTSFEDSGLQTVINWIQTLDLGPPEDGSQALDTYIISNNNPALFAVQPSVSNTGTLTYQATPNANGTAVVTLRARDNYGTANGGQNLGPAQNFSIFITPVNDAPTSVQVQASPLQVPVGGSVSFDATGGDLLDAGETYTYEWNFGDGITVPGKSPTHAFSSPGTYVITATATDSGGLQVAGMVTVEVFPQSSVPFARFTTSDVVGFVGIPLAFDAVYSTDNENDIVSYNWNFGDGSQIGTGQSISRAYQEPGDYTVVLTITDARNFVGQTSKTIVILPSDEIGLFNGYVSYAVRYDRIGLNKDSLTLEAKLNIGDVVPATPVATLVTLAGTTFTGNLNSKLQDSTNRDIKWKATFGTKKQSVGEILLKLTVKKASLGAGFGQAGVLPVGEDSDVSVDLPIVVEIAGRRFDLIIPSEFEFSKNGKKAKGSGNGP